MDESRSVDISARPPLTSHIPVRSISLSIVLAVLLYIGMSTHADWSTLRTSIAVFPTVLWLQILLLSLVSYLLRFARWYHFIVALGYHIPICRNLEIYLAAFALTITPGKAGETIRSVYLHQYGVSYPHSVGAFVSERLLDLVAVGALASMAISIFPEKQIWMLAAISCILSIALFLRSMLLNLIAKRLTKGSVVGLAAKLLATVRFLLSSRQIMTAAPLSLMAWMAQGVSLYLVIHALGYELPAVTVVAIYCLSILAGAASFIPGGLGTTEIAMVLLLSAVGVNQTDAITASLLTRGLTLWLAVGIGIVTTAKIAIAKPTKTPWSVE